MNIWVGIDVSKDTLDIGWVLDHKKMHLQVVNNNIGFKSILKAVPKNASFVMEATGTYYLNVALFLHKSKRHVSVENPIRIKNHMKSDLNRTKTDKADSFSISKFGFEKRPTPWNPPSRIQVQMQQFLTLSAVLAKQITQLTNQIHAFSQSEYVCKDAIKTIKSVIVKLKNQKMIAEKSLLKLTFKSFKRQYEILTSIPSIGPTTACSVIAYVGDLSGFKTSRQLVSYFGLSPTIKQSGSSIKGRGSISRMGGAKIRACLYMGSMTAISCNKGCAEMYNRLKEKGKPGKIANIAVMNKLVRQMFALIKNDCMYDPKFKSKMT